MFSMYGAYKGFVALKKKTYVLNGIVPCKYIVRKVNTKFLSSCIAIL